jgi:hypothetical protein
LKGVFTIEYGSYDAGEFVLKVAERDIVAVVDVRLRSVDRQRLCIGRPSWMGHPFVLTSQGKRTIMVVHEVD